MTTQEKNEWFQSLTPQEQKVQIAKDVLKYLEEGKYEAKLMNGYLRIDWYNVETERIPYEGNLQEFLQKAPTCDVCAKGALLHARVLGYNHFSVDPDDRALRNDGGGFALSDGHTHKGLEGIFSDLELKLIESAYEGTNFVDVFDFGSEAANRGHNASRKYLDLEASERLKAIMENIIENDGEFVI